MTHIVLDQPALDALIAAGDYGHHVLGNVPDWCRHNVPYAGQAEPQVVVKECARCKARRDWEAAKAKVATAVKAA